MSGQVAMVRSSMQLDGLGVAAVVDEEGSGVDAVCAETPGPTSTVRTERSEITTGNVRDLVPTVDRRTRPGDSGRTLRHYRPVVGELAQRLHAYEMH